VTRALRAPGGAPGVPKMRIARIAISKTNTHPYSISSELKPRVLETQRSSDFVSCTGRIVGSLILSWISWVYSSISGFHQPLMTGGTPLHASSVEGHCSSSSRVCLMEMWRIVA
jgi:hypothetical protein